MLGKSRGCGCGHHGFATALGILSGIASLVFLYTIWKNTMVWGLDSTAWFEHVIVFSLAMFGSSSCSCCCGKECCGTCPMQK